MQAAQATRCLQGKNCISRGCEKHSAQEAPPAATLLAAPLPPAPLASGWAGGVSGGSTGGARVCINVRQGISIGQSGEGDARAP